jgi:hypothetical protein
MSYILPAQHELPYRYGSSTSEAAARAAERFVGPQGIEVWFWLRAQGARGGTQREASTALGLGRPSVCARFHALEQRGEIRKVAGTTRERCAVYVAV